MNNVNLTGRLTANIEKRFTPSGIVNIHFNIACNRFVKKENKDNPHIQKADFPRIVAWGNVADFLANYASKGDLIEVVGKLQTGSYEKNGETVYTTEVLVQEAKILSVKKQDQEAVSVKEETCSGFSFTDEDLPFR